MSGLIQFHQEGTNFSIHDEESVADWIRTVVGRHHYSIQEINYIFVTDQYLLEMNQKHLQHDTYTDIITFPYTLPNSTLLIGDIYISVERVTENAIKFNVSPVDEMHRVMIHGILHLVGISDKTPEERAKMELEENIALSLRMF